MSRGNEKKIEESRFMLMSNTAVDLKKKMEGNFATKILTIS